MDLLVQRLKSFDALMLYVRLGHSTLADCTWCHSLTDFALFLLPTIAMQYLRTIMVAGCLTMQGSGKKRWRGWSVGVLIAAACAEVWTFATVDIRMPRPGQPVIMVPPRSARSCNASLILLLLLL